MGEQLEGVELMFASGGGFADLGARLAGGGLQSVCGVGGGDYRQIRSVGNVWNDFFLN